jgi:hypothetical protein
MFGCSEIFSHSVDQITGQHPSFPDQWTAALWSLLAVLPPMTAALPSADRGWMDVQYPCRLSYTTCLLVLGEGQSAHVMRVHKARNFTVYK